MATKTTAKKPQKKTTQKQKTTAKPKPKPAKPNKKTPEKTKKNQEKKEVTKEVTKEVAIPEAGIDFCGAKLTALRRAFLVYYVTPGQPCFHNALQAALKAGYSEPTAKADIYAILREPDIQKIIKTNENLIHQKVHESAMRAIEIKQHRAFFDPIDFFGEKEITVTDKDGGEYTKSVMDLKPLEDMTPEQRLCIDGIDVKSNAAIPVYLMADRYRELNDIIKIDSELAKGLGSTDEEETREIIMERITIRETRRAQRPADFEYEIVERPSQEEGE